MIYEGLTHKIIGCAMKIHSTLGNDFQHYKRIYNTKHPEAKPVLKDNKHDSPDDPKIHTS